MNAHIATEMKGRGSLSLKLALYRDLGLKTRQQTAIKVHAKSAAPSTLTWNVSAPSLCSGSDAMLLNSTGLCELSGSGSKIRTHLKDNRDSAGFRINVDTNLSTDHKATFSSVVVLGDGSRPRLVLDLLVSVCVNPFHLLLHFVCCESLGGFGSGI